MYCFILLLAVITRPPDGVLLAAAPLAAGRLRRLPSPRLVTVISFARCRRRRRPPSCRRSLCIVRQVSLSRRFPGFSVTPARRPEWPWDWPCQKHSLGGHECVCQVSSRSAQPFGRPYGTNRQTDRQTDTHIAFYYIDGIFGRKICPVLAKFSFWENS